MQAKELVGAFDSGSVPSALADFSISAVLAPNRHWTEKYSIDNYCDLLRYSADYSPHEYCGLPKPNCSLGGCSGHGLCTGTGMRVDMCVDMRAPDCCLETWPPV